MSGVSLPAIRGALPSFHKRSYTGLESRPDSRTSSSDGISNTASMLSRTASYGKIYLHPTLTRKFLTIPLDYYTAIQNNHWDHK